MTRNPFVLLYDDPVFVLGAFAYAFLLLASAVGLTGAIVQLVFRGWRHVLWLANAWEWRTNSQDYGPEWSWYLPPPEVINRLSWLLALVAVTLFLAATTAALLGGFVYVIG